MDGFEHLAFFNNQDSRIEMHLKALRDQRVDIGGTSLLIRQGETIRTEYSHKYTLEHFSSLAAKGGFEVQQVWMDESRLFSVQYLRAN